MAVTDSPGAANKRYGGIANTITWRYNTKYLMEEAPRYFLYFCIDHLRRNILSILVRPRNGGQARQAVDQTSSVLYSVYVITILYMVYDGRSRNIIVSCTR